jgi:hypothetical protein
VNGDEASTHRLEAWPEAAGWVLDGLAAAAAAATGLLMVVGVDHGLRVVAAAVLFAFGFGWAVVRAFGAPASSLAALGAVALSISATMLLGEVAVTLLGWAWRVPAVAMCGGTLLGIAVTLSHRERA